MKFMRKKLYKIHRDVGVVIGVFIIIEAITGLMAVWPVSEYKQPIPKVMFKEALQDVAILPAQAVSSLGEELEVVPQINSINLKRILNSLVYVVSSKSNNTFMINANTGERFEITKDLATEIAKDEFYRDVPIIKTVFVDRHNTYYPWGPLPVYKVEFDDPQSTVSYVSITDGTISRDNRSIRIRKFLDTLHSLSIIYSITGIWAYGRGILILLGLITLGLTLTGYYLYLFRQEKA